MFNKSLNGCLFVHKCHRETCEDDQNMGEIRSRSGYRSFNIFHNIRCQSLPTKHYFEIYMSLVM